MEPTLLIPAPPEIMLKIWRWGCAGEGVHTATEPQSRKPAECWLKAVGQREDKDGVDSWLPVEGEELDESKEDDKGIILGRSHPFLKAQLPKDALICVSREHLRLRFDHRRASLHMDNLSSNPVVAGEKVVPAGRSGIALRNGDIIRLVAPSTLLAPGEAEEGEGHGAGVGTELETDEKTPGDLLSSLTYLISLRVHIEQEAVLRCDNESCRGGGGDLLYDFADTARVEPQARQICCWTCRRDLSKNASLNIAETPCGVLQAAAVT